NASRDLVLDCEDVLNLAIEAFRLELVAVAHVNELHANPETFSSFSNATVEKRLDAKPSPDLPRVHGGSAQGKPGCPRGNVKTANLTKGVEYFLGNAVAEIFLVTFCA